MSDSALRKRASKPAQSAPAMPASGSDQQAAAASADAATAPTVDKALLGGDKEANPPSSASPAEKEPEKVQESSLAMKLAGTVLSALLFGWALNKGGVYRSDVIQDQFLFTNNTMLMMFLSATASSILFIALLKASPFRPAVEKAGKKYLTDATISLFSATLGGMMIGIGMRVSGTCPGTIFAQLGSGAVKTWATFGAALLGAFFHGVVREPFMPWLKWGQVKNRPMYAVLGVSPAVTTSAFVVGLAAVVGLVGAFAWEPIPGSAQGVQFTAAYWHPALVGCFVGFLQIPLTLMVQKNLGASTSLSVLVAQAAWCYTGSPYLNKLRADKSKWMDVLFAAVCVLGSTAAAATADPGPNWTTAADMASVSWVEAVIGGFVLGAGARLANGCTSGHGITGAGHQSLVSFVGVAAIFGGGILTALVYAGVNGTL